jgi:hypothetical protein
MLLVKPEGSIEVIKNLTFKKAKELIGGFIARVGCKTGQLLVDEDGYYKALLPNKWASEMYGRPIVGTVIFLTEEETKEFWNETGSEKDTSEREDA